MTATPEQPLPITPDMLLSRRVDFAPVLAYTVWGWLRA